MVDIAGDNTTTRTVSVGGTVTDILEVAGDHDWIRIDLTAGQSISVALRGLTLEDPYLRIRDSSGTVIFENDDNGGSLDSLLAFSAAYTGTYYIDVGAWDDLYAGTYELSVSAYTPPPQATIEQIANQLTHGYWGGSSHHFAVSQGGTLSVNLTGLTSDGQNLARAALATWTDIIGVRFAEVVSGGQIVFDDEGEGASATGVWSGGIISSAKVTVSKAWLTSYGTALNSYSFQTYVHEIGHALGLGHAGGYNGEARYPFDAKFANDAWPLTIMSYFDQRENAYFAGQGFNLNYIVTPMMADILAITTLYGRSTTTRLGDTVYGPGWTTAMGALCLFDSGGTDTIDVSSLSGNQRIDLNPGTFSNVLGEVGIVSIALGVIIENATSGAGADTLIGNDVANVLDAGSGNDSLLGRGGDDQMFAGLGDNSIDGGSGIDTVHYSKGTTTGVTVDLAAGIASNQGGTVRDTLISIENVVGSGWNDRLIGNGGTNVLSGGLGADILTGNGGDDLFLDTAAGMNGDTITDFKAGDRIIISDANLSGFGFSLTGSTLTFKGGTVTLTGFTGQLFASAGASGTVQLSVSGLAADGVKDDFNGDGRSDILWRHNDGRLTDWLGKANGGFTDNYSNAVALVPTSWTVAGTGDFNGDGRSDILWRHVDGRVTDWLGSANGGFADNFANAIAQVATSWHVAGTGDFNGDGRDDILWRHDDGRVSDWLGTPNGGFADNYSNAVALVPTSWRVAGTGDFNGDGHDDILWRHDDGRVTDWLGTASGGFADNFSNAIAAVPTSWHLVATGDFNGDGRDDILWRHDDGRITDWLGRTDGGFTDNYSNLSTLVPAEWQVVATGDYNGDGRDDILWRHDDGRVTDWLGAANGGFVDNYANTLALVPTDWRVQANDILI